MLGIVALQLRLKNIEIRRDSDEMVLKAIPVRGETDR